MNQHPTWKEEVRTTVQHQSESGGCTDLHQHGRGDAASLRDRYRTLHTSCPVFFDQEAGSWLVLRCRDVASLLTDPETFASSRQRASPSHLPPGSVAGIVRRQFLFL